MRDPNDAHLLGVSLKSFVSFRSFGLHAVCALNCRIQTQASQRPQVIQQADLPADVVSHSGGVLGKRLAGPFEQRSHGFEHFTKGKLVVAEKMDQFQGFESIEPAVELSVKLRKVLGIALETRPSRCEILSVEKTPERRR